MLRALQYGFVRNGRGTTGASLVLDFLSGINDSRITYSGGANGTRVNSAGLIVAATCPRFDYDPVTLAAKGLLVEEQRTNLILYSQELDNAAWASDANRGTVTANATTSPDGTVNADKFVAGSDGFGYRFQQPTASASTAYTASIYVKAAETAIVYLELSNTTGLTYFNLSTVAVTATATGATGAFIQAAGNGWYRIGATSTTSGVATTALLNFGVANASGSQVCTAGNGAYFWGAQLE